MPNVPRFRDAVERHRDPARGKRAAAHRRSSPSVASTTWRASATARWQWACSVASSTAARSCPAMICAAAGTSGSHTSRMVGRGRSLLASSRLCARSSPVEGEAWCKEPWPGSGRAARIRSHLSAALLNSNLWLGAGLTKTVGHERVYQQALDRLIHHRHRQTGWPGATAT